jgi:deoxyribonuclease-4
MQSKAMKLVGAHVGIGGGVERAPENAAQIGAKAFAMFTKNQRQWSAAPYASVNRANFKDNLTRCGFTPEQVLPHAGYLINLANPETAARARSVAALTDETRRCAQLGLRCLNLHPGNCLDQPRERGVELAAKGLNRVLAETEAVKVVIETTAGQGTSLGVRFEELAAIMAGIKDQSRVGVCFDTCHVFAAGYDLRTADAYAKTMAEFDRIIGLQRLCGLHLNDSKNGLNSRVDRHASLGKGALGLEVFRCILNDSRFEGLPLILETPDETLWPQEIKMLCALEKEQPVKGGG